MFETGITAGFKFKFEFDRFFPVTDQTGPVSQNRAPAVRTEQSVKKIPAQDKEISPFQEQARMSDPLGQNLALSGPVADLAEMGRTLQALCQHC